LTNNYAIYQKLASSFLLKMPNIASKVAAAFSLRNQTIKLRLVNIFTKIIFGLTSTRLKKGTVLPQWH